MPGARESKFRDDLRPIGSQFLWRMTIIAKHGVNQVGATVYQTVFTYDHRVVFLTSVELAWTASSAVAVVAATPSTTIKDFFMIGLMFEL